MKLLPVLFILMAILCQASCGTSPLNDGNDPADTVQKFLGNWSVSDEPARLNYQVLIKRSPTQSDQVIMENFADLGNMATGLVVNNTIVIDLQDIGGGFKTEGTGSFISEKRLEFEFFLDDSINNELRKAVFTR